MLKINLGSCSRDFPGFLSVDRCPPADQIVDLEGPWPWADSSVDEVLAISVFEHVANCDHVAPGWMCPRCTPHRCGKMMGENILIPDPLPLPLRVYKGKIHVMNELWRVLRPGALATIVVPHGSQGDGGHCDPTHETYWTQSDFEYYTGGDAHRERFDGYYGVNARFEVTNLDQGKIPLQKHPRRYGGHVVEMTVKVRAVK